jgi:hypothetical protein
MEGIESRQYEVAVSGVSGAETFSFATRQIGNYQNGF